jgi:hypothetical protein
MIVIDLIKLQRPFDINFELVVHVCREVLMTLLIKGESADLEPPAPQHLLSASAPFQHLSNIKRNLVPGTSTYPLLKI